MIRNVTIGLVVGAGALAGIAGAGALGDEPAASASSVECGITDTPWDSETSPPPPHA